MQKEIKDKYGNIYTNRFARFLGGLNKEIRDMKDEANMIPVNVSMKVDTVGDSFVDRLKKICSVFKRKKK